MDIILLIVLVVVAVLLFLAELFIVPGISIAGILSGCCIIYANYHAFSVFGTTIGCITLLVSAVAFIGSLVWFMKSKTLDKLSLKKEISSTVKQAGSDNVQIGDTGISTTRLALIGYADFNGHIIEVKSTAEFIDAKTPIKIVRIVDGIILVEKAEQ